MLLLKMNNGLISNYVVLWSSSRPVSLSFCGTLFVYILVKLKKAKGISFCINTMLHKPGVKKESHRSWLGRYGEERHTQKIFKQTQTFCSKLARYYCLLSELLLDTNLVIRISKARTINLLYKGVVLAMNEWIVEIRCHEDLK